jgi:hypothetical protein
MNSQTATLDLDEWQILFHETMAALLRAKEALNKQFGFWGILNGLWRSSRDLKALNSALKALSEAPDGRLSEEFILSHIPQVRKLLKSIEELIDAGRAHGLTNRTLTSAPLESIRSRGEYISSYLETLEISIDPDVLRTIDEARTQIENGEFEVMERLF